MSYVDFYISPVLSARFADYEKMAIESAAIWKELGALSVVETRAENAPVGG